jgi:hypothetical protein
VSATEERHEPLGCCTARRADRWAGRVECAWPFNEVADRLHDDNDQDIPAFNGGVSMTARRGRTPQRVRFAYVEWVAERLSARDRAILASIYRLRLATGQQLERLHFSDLTTPARARVRRRVLARLVRWRVLASLDRRIGGVRAGSSGLVFALDSAGQQLVRLDANLHGYVAGRRPREPSSALLGHTLTVAELYVQLVERSRLAPFTVAAFDTEPACWHPDGLGRWLKPDAYVKLSTDAVSDHWWVEVDKGTEHLPTIRRKLVAYVDFAASGGLGPGNVLPRVLVTVPTEARQAALAEVIGRLPEPAAVLMHVTTETAAVPLLVTAVMSD